MGITEIYCGWDIGKAFIGYEAIHPDYDYDPETGENGLCIHGMTVEDVKAQIDDKILEMEE